eukprot:c25886_g1_i3 orf=55-2838(+)
MAVVCFHNAAVACTLAPPNVAESAKHDGSACLRASNQRAHLKYAKILGFEALGCYQRRGTSGCIAVAEAELPMQSRSHLSTDCPKRQGKILEDERGTCIGQTIRKYSYHVEGGGQVRALVSEVDGKYKVVVEASSIPNVTADDTLAMHWGHFKSDYSNWTLFHPGGAPSGIPSVTELTEAMQTLLNHGQCGIRILELEFESKHAPFLINFALCCVSGLDRKKMWIRNGFQSNFCIPVGLGWGQPEPLGITIGSDGSVNFALYSRHAKNVVLCLYDSDSTDPCLEIDLDCFRHRTGDIWHIKLEKPGCFTRYGYRCKGDLSWEKGNRFHPHHVLVDPYAKILAPIVPAHDGLSSSGALLGSLITEKKQFDWGDDSHPDIPLECIFAYRLNVRGFTADKSSGLDKTLRGTFEGVAEKVQHLRKLGVNAVILQPIFAYNKRKGCFHPFSFFAPMDCFGPSNDSLSASVSLKKMVKALHEFGIEVILDVVYSHTGEGGDEEPETVSFRGIDNATYYILDRNDKVSGSEFGSTNLFNCNHPVVHRMILDSLRYWVTEYHVDGFCFANATMLTIGPHGEELSRPVLVEAISFDPILARRKLIADTCSPSTRLCKMRSFPHWKRWCEWNGLFRDDIRRFLRGDKGQLSRFATRLCGSGDLFAGGRGPSYSINFVSSHYGLTLVDLVSYSEMGRLENDFSWNCGEEGLTNNEAVLAIRVKQVCNFLACLFLSQGVPVLSMGDECGISKGGSTSFEERSYNWDALKTEYGIQTTQFISSLSTFRSRRSDLLQCHEFISLANVKWHGVKPDQLEWMSTDSSFLAVSLQPNFTGSNPNRSVGDIYIGFNPHNESVVVSLPALPEGMIWHRIVDTSLPYPENFVQDGISVEISEEDASPGGTYKFQSYTCALLEAHIADETKVKIQIEDQAEQQHEMSS